MARTSAARSNEEEAGGRGRSQELILDAAEQLFADNGYQGTTLRQIADAAGVNLGMFHYYWGSKQALCKAVLERRLGPIMAERRARFEAVRDAGGSLEDLLAAGMEPSLTVAGATPDQRERFRNFYGRMLSDPSPDVREAVAAIFDDFAREFMDELHERCSHIGDQEFYWRMVFLYGAFLYAHNTHNRIHALLGARFNPPPIENGVEYLVRFTAAGLREGLAAPAGPPVAPPRTRTPRPPKPTGRRKGA